MDSTVPAEMSRYINGTIPRDLCVFSMSPPWSYVTRCRRVSGIAVRVVESVGLLLGSSSQWDCC